MSFCLLLFTKSFCPKNSVKSKTLYLFLSQKLLMSSPSIPLPLKIEHSARDRVYWNFLNMIPFLIGSIGIARDSLKWVTLYIGIALFFFLILKFRFFCTHHCFYYIRSKGRVKCMMLPGVPKVFKDRPYLHKSFEKVIVVLGALPVFLFPVYWLVGDSLLLGAYIIAWALFFLTVQRYECIKCINFECPVKRVPAEMRNDFKNKSNLSDNFDISADQFRVSGSTRCASLKIKHEFKDFLYWNFVTLILLFSAGLAIGIYSTGWMFAYIFLVIFHFNILEQRFFCTHCPYYARDGKKLRCMMNWAWPKHFRPRPYPQANSISPLLLLGL